MGMPAIRICIPAAKLLAAFLQKVDTDGAEDKVLAPLVAALQSALSSLAGPDAFLGADKQPVVNSIPGGVAGQGEELPAGGSSQEQQLQGGSVSALRVAYKPAKEGGDGGVPRRCDTRASPH